ncbi:MAG TPA: hypothetical protein VF297_14240 [Pyrinomonadaceae bacterium]
MRTVRRPTGALLIIALTLLAAAFASAQTGTTTTPKQVAATDSTAVTSVGLDAGVTSMAADANGNLYASLQYTNKVVKLNGAGTVIGTFAVGRNPTGLLVDNNNGGWLYVLNNADNTVSKLKLDGTPVATFNVAGDGPVHAALYGGVLYVACERSNTLVRLSSTDGTALGSTGVGARPVWVVVSVTTTKYYYSGSNLVSADGSAITPTGDGTIQDCLDCGGESSTVDASTTTDGGGTAPPPESGTGGTTLGGATESSTTSTRTTKTVTTVNVYVSCNKANEVWKVSSAGALVAKFATGRGPFGLAVNSRGELFVACFWDSFVQRFNSSGTVLSKTVVGDGPAGMIPYGGSNLAVVSNGANSVTRLSLADGTIISKDLVDRSPLIGAATPSALWVACTGSGTIAKRAL